MAVAIASACSLIATPVVGAWPKSFPLPMSSTAAAILSRSAISSVGLVTGDAGLLGIGPRVQRMGIVSGSTGAYSWLNGTVVSSYSI